MGDAVSTCWDDSPVLHRVSLSAGRAAVANALTLAQESAAGAERALGAVVLREHQRAAVVRLRQVIAAHGGALLADDVGLGKTFVAIAVMADYAAPCVLAPAALVPMWRAALAETGVRAVVRSYEALSRGAGTHGARAPDIVVLDEAHHARNAHTRRYRRIASMARHARVLLVSATPVHNARRDLENLFALFLGARAHVLTDDDLAAILVRRERGDIAFDAPLPDVAAMRWLDVGDDAGVLDALLALPPPLPPADGGAADALLTLALVRQWASSHAALCAALRRRLARTRALEFALECGRYPTRAELAAWVSDDVAQQLAFPEIVAAGTVPTRADGAVLLGAVRAHAAAVRTLIAHIGHGDGPDGARARALQALRARHPRQPIVAFSEYAETVHALWRRLRGEAGVAALTARGALTAGGTLTRAEALARFAPLGTGTAPPPARERIELLLTTDLLSEGVNLQDASVVVHLDLPWSPARLEQRVGRLRRMGSPHARIHVYALRPPDTAEAVLGAQRVLREKMRVAHRAIGVAGVLPAWPPNAPIDTRVPHSTGASTKPVGRVAPARAREMLLRAVARWRDAPCANTASGVRVPPHAAVAVTVAIGRAETSAVLAVVCDDGRAVLVGSAGDGRVGAHPRALLRAVEIVEGAVDWKSKCSDDLGFELLRRAVAELHAWGAAHRAGQTAGVTQVVSAPARRSALRRIAQVAARAPIHARPRVAALASRARAAVTAPFGIAAEHALSQLVDAAMPGEAWLRALSAFGDANARRTADTAQAVAPRLVTIVLVIGDDSLRGLRDDASQ